MYINIALPKGRLGKRAYELLKLIGYDCPQLEGESRKLVFENEEKQLRFFMVKASDVPVFVQKGVADIGIVGKDILAESGQRMLEMVDLNFGKCRFAVAAPRGFVENYQRPLIVATKYIQIAKAYYALQNREIELVKLNGSVEIAPLVGLADVIVDIVETGTTLRENNLEVQTYFMDISARCIVNEANYRFKNEAIDSLINSLRGEINK
ncbi:MAG: ATP phosphoribosyltransferase [Culicoidibacterales bacterium]